MFDWNVFGATYDAGSILEPDSWEILHPSKWPDQRLRRLVDGFKTVTNSYHDEEGNKVTRTTVEVRFAPRHGFYDRIATMMGMKRKVDIQLAIAENGGNLGRSIPIEVIDAITAKWDPPTKKMSIEEIDRLNPEDEEGG